MYLRSLLTAAVACAAIFTSQAQTIQAPASSIDSSARAVVAITPVDTSNLATKTEVNNAYNLANTAYNTASTANSNASSALSYGYAAYVNGGYGRPWSHWYKGSYSGTTCGWSAVYGSVCAYGYVDGNGYVSAYVYNSGGTLNGWRSLGYPGSPTHYLGTSGSTSWCDFNGCYSGAWSVSLGPSGFGSNGVPYGWVPSVSAY